MHQSYIQGTYIQKDTWVSIQGVYFHGSYIQGAYIWDFAVFLDLQLIIKPKKTTVPQLPKIKE